MKKYIYIILLIIFLPSCIIRSKIWVYRFVNPKDEKIKINIDLLYKPSCLYSYSDTLYKYFPQYRVPDSLNINYYSCNSSVYDTIWYRKCYYFNDSIEEVYMVRYFNLSSCKTMVGYVKDGKVELRNNRWMKKNYNRVQDRMNNEIINKMILFMDSTCMKERYFNEVYNKD